VIFKLRWKKSALQELPNHWLQAEQVLGRFFPKVDLSNYEPLEPQVSEEELDRRSKSKGKCYTTAEVVAYLESL
jgi:hypothetical protein